MANSPRVQANGFASTFSQFVPFDLSTLSSLATKTNLVFGACVASVSGFCLYHLREGYRYWNQDPSSQLSEQFKRVQSEVLLKDIESMIASGCRPEEIKPLLQKCETLQASTPNGKYGLSGELVWHYAQVDMKHAEKLASYLSLTEALQITNSFLKLKIADENKLLPIFEILLSTHEQRLSSTETSQKDTLDLSLNLSLAFDKFQNQKDKIDAIKLALAFQKKEIEPTNQLISLCKIAKICHKTGAQEQYEELLEEIKTTKISGEHSLYAHLARVELLLHISLLEGKEFLKADKELLEPVEAFDAADLTAKIKHLPGFSKVIKQTSKNASSELNSLLLKQLVDIKTALSKNPGPSEINAVHDQARAYLSLAATYKELLDEGNASSAIDSAVRLLKAVWWCADTVRDRHYLLAELLDSRADKAVKEAQKLFESLSVKEHMSSPLSFAYVINTLYKDKEDKLSKYTDKYLLEIQDKENSLPYKVLHLCSAAKELPTCQGKLLKAAEDLVSSCPLQAPLIAEVARAYLGTNSLKSKELLQNYATSLAARHFVKSAFAAIAAGMMCVFSPTTRIFSLLSALKPRF